MTSYSISYFSALVTSIVIVFFKVMILHLVSFHYVSLSRSESSVGLQKARESPESLICRECLLWGRCVRVTQQQCFESGFHVDSISVTWWAKQVCVAARVAACLLLAWQPAYCTGILARRDAFRAPGQSVATQAVETQPIWDWGPPARGMDWCWLKDPCLLI